MKDESKSIDRRGFFRALALGGLGATGGVLATRAVQTGVCIGDARCRICRVNERCALPLAKDFRKYQKEQAS